MALKPVIGGAGLYNSSTYTPAQFAADSADPTKTAAGTFTSLGIQFSPGNIYGHIFFSGGVLVIGSDTGELSLAPSGSSIFMTALDTTFNHVSTAVFSFGNALNGDGCVQQFLNASSIPAVTGGSNIGSLNGVMSVANDGETLPLPLLRKVGNGSNNVPSSVANNSVSSIGFTITGVLATDVFVVNFNGALPTSASGALIKQSEPRYDSGTIYVDFYNTDLLNPSGLTTVQATVTAYR